MSLSCPGYLSRRGPLRRFGKVRLAASGVHFAVMVSWWTIVLSCIGPEPVAGQFEPNLTDHAANSRSLAAEPSVSAASDQVEMLELSQLSDAQLLDLYEQTYRQSLRSIVADETAVVDRAHVLLQAGYTYSYDRYADIRNTTHTVPELLLRYRPWERLELRVAWAGVVFDRLSDTVTGVADWDTRLSDPAVGARCPLWTQKDWIPSTSVTVSSPLNVESDANLGYLLDPFVGLGCSWRLGTSWCISGSSAAVWTREEESNFLDYQQTVSVDCLLGERWDLFGQWSGLFPEGARLEGINHSLGPGLAYSLTADLQCETALLVGLSEHAPDTLVQLLVSWRP